MARINQTAYRHFVLTERGIESGWEYAEDARDAQRESGGKVLTLRALKARGIDPDRDAAWVTRPLTAAEARTSGYKSGRAAFRNRRTWDQVMRHGVPAVAAAEASQILRTSDPVLGDWTDAWIEGFRHAEGEQLAAPPAGGPTGCTD